jgi:hypothetical protein
LTLLLLLLLQLLTLLLLQLLLLQLLRSNIGLRKKPAFGSVFLRLEIYKPDPGT